MHNLSLRCENTCVKKNSGDQDFEPEDFIHDTWPRILTLKSLATYVILKLDRYKLFMSVHSEIVNLKEVHTPC